MGIFKGSSLSLLVGPLCMDSDNTTLNKKRKYVASASKYTKET